MCAVSLAVLSALTYEMLWVKHSSPKDLGGRGAEQHVCWFWLEDVVFVCLLWAVCGTNYSHLFPCSITFLHQKGVSCRPLGMPYICLPDCSRRLCAGCVLVRCATVFVRCTLQSTKQIFMAEWICYGLSGPLKKEKMSVKIFQWSSIEAFIYDFLISSVKVFGVFLFISSLLWSCWKKGEENLSKESMNSIVQSICFVSLWECVAAVNSVPDYSKLSECRKSLEMLLCFLNYWEVIQRNYFQIWRAFPAFF